MMLDVLHQISVVEAENVLQRTFLTKGSDSHPRCRHSLCLQELYEKVMLWCWEIDPKNRPSFKQLADKLKKFTVQL